MSQHIALVRLRDTSLAPWVHRWLVSPNNGRQQLLGSSYGDKPGLNLAQVKSVLVDIPPANERELILSRMDRYSHFCDDLESALRTAEDTSRKLADALVAELLA